MKWKFLREHHNRQERARNGSGGCPGSGSATGKPSRVWEEEFHIDWSTNPPQFYIRRRYNEQIDKQEHKAEIRDSFLWALHSLQFIVEGYKFKFTFTLRQFAQANNLDLRSAERPFREISRVAEGKREIVLRRFRRAPLEFTYQRTPNGKDSRRMAKVQFDWTDILKPENK